MEKQSDVAPRVLFGRVVDDQSGRPLAGATIERAGTTSATTQTDDSGAFTLPVPVPGTSVELRISYEGSELSRQTVAPTAAPVLLRVAASSGTVRTRATVGEHTPTPAELHWLTRAVADARIARAAGRPTNVPAELVASDECTCDACMSAVSPVAYLADLISYLTSAVTTGGATIDLGWLERTFLQPFGELLLSCEDVERSVRQVRICIETLRRWITAPQPVAGEDRYQLNAYRQLLQRQGTTVDEIRLATHADADVRASLALRLGIETGTRPDRLDALALSTSAITEELLETLFSLVDTTLARNPLSDGVTRNDSVHQIRRWNVEHVAWGRNTDRDGVAYLTLSNTAQSPDVTIYRDAARTQLIASGSLTPPAAAVTLTPQNGSLLHARIELQASSDTKTIELQLIPKLVAWRLDHLRTVWAEADRPSNVFADLSSDVPVSQRRPIIDPDVISVDDFRYPYAAAAGAPDAAFDVWLRRRAFVDTQLHELHLLTKQVPTPTGPITVPDFEKILTRNFAPVQYGPATNPPVPVWAAPLTLADLDRIARDLSRPDTAAAARARVIDGFHLELTAFTRLLELRQRDRHGDTLAADEWEEVFSIIVQGQKQALVVATSGAGWLVEEAKVFVDLGPETFWLSETEPKPGNWPPLPTTTRPLIDPELRRVDLPDDVAGRRAVAVWHARQQQLAAFTDSLQDAHDAKPFAGLEPLFVLAFGPAPPGGWVSHLQALAAALDGPNPAPAQQEITQKLHVALDDFPRLVALMTRAQPGSTEPALAPSEWDEIFAMLTSAAKAGQISPAWVNEEHQFGFDQQYWWAIKAALPLWRASPDTRAAWQQALRDRSEPAIVDPDQLELLDFIDPDPRDAAYALYQQRDQALGNEVATLAQFVAGAANPLDAFDALLMTVLFAESDDTKLALAGPMQQLASDRTAYGSSAVGGLLQQVFGAPLPDFKALQQGLANPSTHDDALRTVTESLFLTPTSLDIVVAMQANASPSPAQWQTFEEVLAGTILIGSVVGQHRADAAGADITARLTQLGLDYNAFDRLVQLRRVAAIGAIDSDEWNDVYGILIVSRKRRWTARWRDAEKASSVVGGPDHFTVPTVAPLTFPPPPPPERDPWRFDRQTRARWDQTLASRIAEQQGVIEAENAVVTAVEESLLPSLRDALIIASQAPGLPTAPAKEPAVTRRLQIDAAAGGCQKTTRVSQAMRTLQGFAFAIRNGDLASDQAQVALTDQDFDAKWSWMGSYATWRAAMLVFLYPENLLVPTLRRRQSPALAWVIDASRSAGGLSPEAACEAARTFAGYFHDLFRLRIVATCQTNTPMPPQPCTNRVHQPPFRPLVYVFGLTSDNQRLYWSSYDASTRENVDLWQRIDAVKDVQIFLGVMPWENPSGEQSLLAFFVQHDIDQSRLCMLQMKPQTAVWDSEPTVLDLPKSGTLIGAVLKQTMGIGDPHIAVQFAGSADIQDNVYDVNHMRWQRSWRVLYTISPLPYFPARGTLRAVVDHGYLDFWLLIGDSTQTFAILIQPFFIPVFRLRSPDDDRFMTTDPAERDHAVSALGHSFECVPFFLIDWTPPFPPPISAPSEYRRYVSLRSGHHVYWPAQGTVDPNHYRYEATLGYVSMDPSEAELSHILMLYKPVAGSDQIYFYTCQAQEAADQINNGGWKDGSIFPSRAAANSWLQFPGEYLTARSVQPGESYFVNKSGDCWRLESPSSPPTLFPSNDSEVAPHSGGPGVPAGPHPFGGMDLGGAPNLRPMVLSGNQFTLLTTIQVAFTPSNPTSGNIFDLGAGLTAAELQTRRQDELALYGQYKWFPSLAGYLSEAYFYVPVQLTLQLQASGQSQAALDWMRLVYDWSADGENRKIYFWLTQEEHGLDFSRATDWLLDPLNPHLIAQTRGWAYTAFTVQTIAKLFLFDADGEFTRDTAESLERARILYQQAIYLLGSNDLAANNGCYDLVVDIPEPGPIIYALRERLLALGSRPRVAAAAAAVKAALASTQQPLAQRIARALTIVNDSAPRSTSTLAEKLARRQALLGSTSQLLADFAVADDTTRVAAAMAADAAAPLDARRIVSEASILAAFDFCIPPNPVLHSLLLHAQLNLYKLRTCRNIAGLRRDIDPYAAPTDVATGLPSIGPGGQLIVPGATTLQPAQYRYATLIERAKQLQQLANQTEASMLAAFEKRDAEAYAALRAQQDLATARAQVQVQTLKTGEAQVQARVAQLQVARAQLQSDQYNGLIEGGLSGLEIAAMATHAASAALYASAAVYSFFQQNGVGAGLANSAQAIGVTASILDTQASFERRAQQWQDAKALADQDVLIGNLQVAAANINVLVATQERNVANIQADHAQATVQFLANKFTNVELYDFMATEYQRVYSFFLREATAMAQLAQTQLAFERQQMPPPFIQPDYWRAPSDTSSTSSGNDSTDRRGLTGSARLLQDIYQLDLYAQQTNQRKLQLSRTLSLATLYPIEFGLFQQSGALPFSTTLELFDRDFPGHYARLIRRVRVSLIALVPPSIGIRATLSSTGTSRVVVAGEPFSTAVIVREPQSASYTSPNDATGVFELDPQSDLLLPFEGLGVASDWRFELPRASNPIDFSSIADILITFEYTAFDSYDYQQQVRRALSPFTDGDRPFSFVNDLADAWWDLHNPDQIATPMSVNFRTERSDFPPNVDELAVAHVAIFIVRADGQSFELPVTLRFRADDAGGAVGGSAVTVDGLVSTRSANGSSWLAIVGKSPVGEWQFTLPNTGEIRHRLAQEKITDILFVITFSGRTPRWPA